MLGLQDSGLELLGLEHFLDTETLEIGLVYSGLKGTGIGLEHLRTEDMAMEPEHSGLEDTGTERDDMRLAYTGMEDRFNRALLCALF